MTEIFVDFSRSPNVRQHRSLEARSKKLNNGLLASAVDADKALKAVGVHVSLKSLRVRRSFVVHAAGVVGEYSDRKVLPREERPNLTRIMSSTGLGMRLALTSLAIAQSKVHAGARYRNSMDLRGSSADGPGWVEVVATKSQHVTGGETSLTINDKKERQVKTALDRLAQVGLVELGSGRGAHKYNRFGLLEEGDGPRRDYTVPQRNDLVSALPATFITNGWIHVLEDTEIALLFMLATRVGSIDRSTAVAIPAHTRNVQYGIGREAFESYRALEWLKLISASETNRHYDGRAIEFSDEGADLHRLELLPVGFDRSAFEVVPTMVKYQLGRGNT